MRPGPFGLEGLPLGGPAARWRSRRRGAGHAGSGGTLAARRSPFQLAVRAAAAAGAPLGVALALEAQTVGVGEDGRPHRSLAEALPDGIDRPRRVPPPLVGRRAVEDGVER